MKMLFIVFLFIFNNELTSQNALPFRVYFEYDSAKLDTIQQKRLMRFFEFNFKNHSIDSISIDGYTDDIGGEFYNDNLSLRRANSVFFIIDSLLQSKVKIEINGFGILPIENQSEIDQSRKENRKAFINVYYSKKLEEKKTKEDTISEKMKLISFFKDSKIGEKLKLNILFEGGTHKVLDKSKRELLELLELLKLNKNKISIQGHVCCLQRFEKDGIDVETGVKNLSFARAKAVLDFLVKRGILIERLKAEGFGGKFKTGKGDEQDRRVEIEIVE